MQLRRRGEQPVRQQQAAPADVPTYQVDLPSNGLFYNGQKTITVSTFTVGQIRQLKALEATADPGSQELALASIVAKSVHDFDVFDLTYGDYVFLLFWIRLNTYKKSPFNVSYQYGEDIYHVTVQQTDLLIKEVDEAKYWNPQYGYPTVRDKVLLSKCKDVGEAYQLFQASYLSQTLGDLKARSEFIDSKPAWIVKEIEEHASDFEHGVEESITIKHQTQEGPKEVKIAMSLNIADFFP